MLCQRCNKNTATVNYVQVTNGKRFECNLCAACYADLYDGFTAKADSGLVAGFFGPKKCVQKHVPFAALLTRITSVPVFWAAQAVTTFSKRILFRLYAKFRVKYSTSARSAKTTTSLDFTVNLKLCRNSLKRL